MRRLIDILVVVTVLALLGGATWQYKANRDLRRDLDAARQAVRTIHSTIMLHAVLKKDGQSDTARGPLEVDPAWFGETLPEHPLLGSHHPWLEIADPSQRRLIHPPQRIAMNSSQARFWYNPYTGVVRGRVPPGVSDAVTLQWYNHINDCDLANLFESPPASP